MPRGEPRGHGIFCHVGRRIRKGRPRLAGARFFARFDRRTRRRRRRRRRRRLPRRRPMASGATGRLAAARCAARRHSKDTTRLGLLGAQPAARAVRTASRCHCVFLLLPPSSLRPPSPTSAIQPVYRCIQSIGARRCRRPATAAAAAAPTIAIAAANCIDARHPEATVGITLPPPPPDAVSNNP